MIDSRLGNGEYLHGIDSVNQSIQPIFRGVAAAVTFDAIRQLAQGIIESRLTAFVKKERPVSTGDFSRIICNIYRSVVVVCNIQVAIPIDGPTDYIAVLRPMIT